VAAFEADPDRIRDLGDLIEQALGSAEGAIHRAAADYGQTGLGAEVTRYSDRAHESVTKLLGEAREIAGRLRLTAEAYAAADEESSGASKQLESQTPAVTQ
jgi:hypothetical protein